MEFQNNRHTYRMFWSSEDEEYVGVCLEFPSLSWLDESPESSLRGIRNVVAEVVADLKESSEGLPEP